MALFERNQPVTAHKDSAIQKALPDSKVHGANMEPTGIWGRQDPGGPHVGPMSFAFWVTMPWRHHVNNCQLHHSVAWVYMYRANHHIVYTHAIRANYIIPLMYTGIYVPVSEILKRNCLHFHEIPITGFAENGIE